MVPEEYVCKHTHTLLLVWLSFFLILNLLLLLTKMAELLHHSIRLPCFLSIIPYQNFTLFNKYDIKSFGKRSNINTTANIWRRRKEVRRKKGRVEFILRLTNVSTNIWKFLCLWQLFGNSFQTKHLWRKDSDICKNRRWNAMVLNDSVILWKYHIDSWPQKQHQLYRRLQDGKQWKQKKKGEWNLLE